MKLLARRSDCRLAEEIVKQVVNELDSVGSIMDIGCGDGIVGKTIRKEISYIGVDLDDSRIYEKNNADSRIVYATSENLDEMLADANPVDLVLLLDVLEHTKDFTGLFVKATGLASKYIVVSLPNELFFLDRLRVVAGRELPAHSLDLVGLPEGFKHQFIVNINKARNVLDKSANDHGFRLLEEYRRPLISKSVYVQPLLWALRLFTSSQLWSMGSVFVYERIK